MYIADATTILEKHGLSSHFYADDIQLYVSCRRGDTTACANRVSVCTEDITRWMASNRLVVNPIKTDGLWCSSSQPPPDTPLLPSGTTVQPSASLRNLCVLFDTDLSLAAHVNHLTALCYSSLRRIKRCCCALTRSASVILVNSFIVSKLDYCNSLFAGCSKQLVDKLLCVLNCAAWVIFGGDSWDHATPLLRDKLHCLGTRERITFKLCLLVYTTTNGFAPSGFLRACNLQLFPPVPPSVLQLMDTLSSLVPGDVSATGHFTSPVPQRGTACRQTFELLFLLLLLRIYSRIIYLSIHIIQHKLVSHAVQCPCSDFINCRIIIIIIIIISVSSWSWSKRPQCLVSGLRPICIVETSCAGAPCIISVNSNANKYALVHSSWLRYTSTRSQSQLLFILLI